MKRKHFHFRVDAEEHDILRILTRSKQARQLVNDVMYTVGYVSILLNFLVNRAGCCATAYVREQSSWKKSEPLKRNFERWPRGEPTENETRL